MIQRFVDKFMAAEQPLKAEFKAKRPENYDALVKRLLVLLSDRDSVEDNPDPERLTIIDHGDYQGTRLYVVAASGYLPSVYWSIFVPYGSCSGCDTFEANQGYRVDDDPIDDEEANGNWTMMLHMVQSMQQIVDGNTDTLR
jgi:hypothetical protein